jgi:hypothetical protein
MMREPIEVLRKEAQQRLQLAVSHGGWEGTHTDFKRKLESQPRDLAKVMRHILAFANTPRRTDAYIIFGVNEDKTIKIFEHVGVDSEGFPLKERLDELVRHYTKLKGVLVDDSFVVDGKRTPYIAIPMQYEGPYTLTQSLPGLDAGVVYCRYGSLSAPATDRDERRMAEDWDTWFLDCRYAESATSLIAALHTRFPAATSLRDMGRYIRLTYNSNVTDEFGIQTTPVLVHAYWGFEPLGMDTVETLTQDLTDPSVNTRKLIAARFMPAAQERAIAAGVRCHPLEEIYFVNDSYASLCREFLHKWEDERTRLHLDFIIDLDYRASRESTKVDRSILTFLEQQLNCRDRVAIVVHGDFGCGKTTTANELVAQLSREYLRGNSSVPKVLYLDVNNMDIRSRRDECIQSQLLRLRLSRDHVDRLVSKVLNDEIHLVFDGVDEMARPYTFGGRKEAMQILADIGNRSAAAYFVRGSYYPELNEMLQQFGLLAQHDLETGEQKVVVAEILHLRDEQVVKYLDDRLGKSEGTVLRSNLNKLGFASFMRDPLIMSMIVQFGIEGFEAVAKEDVKAHFLSKLVLKLVDREQEKRQRQGAFATNIPLFLRVLRFVAFSMVCRGYSTLSPTQLEGFVQRALDAPNGTAEMVDAFRTMSWIHRSESGNVAFRHEVLTVVCAAQHIAKAFEQRNMLDVLDWQESAPHADVTCQYAGRILTASGFLGAVALLGEITQRNIKCLLTSVLSVARNRELAEARNMYLDVRTIAAICRGLAQEPSLISQASKALLGYIGDRRRVQIIVPLLWSLVRDESPEGSDSAVELLEFDRIAHKSKGEQRKGDPPKRNFTHLLGEIRDDPTSLMDVMLLKELELTTSELLDCLNYEPLFERIRERTKSGDPAVYHYADRTVKAIEGERGRRKEGVDQNKGKRRPRKTYTKIK